MKQQHTIPTCVLEALGGLALCIPCMEDDDDDDDDVVGDDENNVDDEDDGKEQDDYVGDSGDSLLQP